MKCRVRSCTNDALEGIKVCQSCREKESDRKKLYRANNADKIREQKKASYYRCQDANIARSKKYVEQNKEKVAEYQRKYGKENRDRLSQYHKGYREVNKDRLREASKIYHCATKERRKINGKLYYQRNKDRISEVNKLYKASRKEYIRTKNKEYYSKNPDVRYRNHCLRKERIRDAFIENVNRSEIFERDNWTCQLCGEPVDKNVSHQHPLYPTIDHIIPLSRGGTHEPFNVHTAHLRCNISKRDKLLTDDPDVLNTYISLTRLALQRLEQP